MKRKMLLVMLVILPFLMVFGCNKEGNYTNYRRLYSIDKYKFVNGYPTQEGFFGPITEANLVFKNPTTEITIIDNIKDGLLVEQTDTNSCVDEVHIRLDETTWEVLPSDYLTAEERVLYTKLFMSQSQIVADMNLGEIDSSFLKLFLKACVEGKN